MIHFPMVIAEVAKALGGTVVRAPDDENAAYAEITLDVFPVSIYYDTYRKKLSISIKPPKWTNAEGGSEQVPFSYVETNEERKNGLTTNIHCSPEKAPEKIAADIRNRLGKHGKGIYDRAVAYASMRETEANGKRATVQALAEHFGVKAKDHSPDRLYVNNLLLTVSSANSVRFSDFDCTPEMAKKIVALLATERKDD